MSLPTLLAPFLRTMFPDRHRLPLENLALRQQLADLKRKVPHPRLADFDRSPSLTMR